MLRVFLTTIVCLLTCGIGPTRSPAADLSAREVLQAIERGRRLLLSVQQPNGSWTARTRSTHPTGVSSLTLLALLNSGLTLKDEPVQRGLTYLRRVREPEDTYEVSLMISALATAKDGRRDMGKITSLARKLAQGQITTGANIGLWDYKVGRGPGIGGDRSNGQFAVLGLRDAAFAGVPIDRQVWMRVRNHWTRFQNGDGGWNYAGSGGASNSTGSMTVAGIATLQISGAMLQDDKDLNPDGTPSCCANSGDDLALNRALAWLSRNFAVGHNPRANNSWLLYYLYGMERAGRLSGRRFFGNHDWYREGAKFLVEVQSQRTGGWRAAGIENDPVIATSFALLFLSKGLAPVLVNKLQFGNDTNWNRHTDDARNLTEHISGLPKWPKLLTWQVVDVNKSQGDKGVRDLLQGSVQLITGETAPDFNDQQVVLLRKYLDQGGFLFAVNCCNGSGFYDGMFELVKRLFPDGEAELKPLPPTHPVYRSEYLFTETESVKLYGVDFGCRTVIIFTPEDLSCLWDKRMQQDPPGRPVTLVTSIQRALRIGVNVIAYASGREPPNKLDQQELADQSGQQDQVERGLFKLPKLRHTGGWNDAPQSVRNLLLALNRTVDGLTASTRARHLPATDPSLFRYPVVFMHGRNRFEFSEPELRQLRKYLDRGGLLFADAICGARPFDLSFRRTMAQLYPDAKLERIPVEHELFRLELGHDIRKVKRRVVPGNSRPDATLQTVIREGEPYLEGLRIDDRYVVIYSRYDLSCALQRQSSVACAGYLAKDAVRIAVNVILYAMLQDVSTRGLLEHRSLTLEARPVLQRNP